MRPLHQTASLVLTIEALVLAVACAWGALRNIPFWTALTLYPSVLLWVLAGILLGAGMFGLSLLAFRLLRHLKPNLGWIFDEILYPLFVPLSTGEVALLCIASGVCEEILFRGVMQADLGLWTTSLLFGILHTGERRLLGMGLWSTLAGLMLGVAYQRTETLWFPIAAHAANNWLAIWYLQRTCPYATSAANPWPTIDST